MWLLPEQARALVAAAGLQAGPPGCGEYLLDASLEPVRCGLRLELRSAGAAPGTGAGGEVDLRYGLWEADLRALLAAAGLRAWLPAAPQLRALAAAFMDHELLRLEVALGAGAEGLRFDRAAALCDDNAAFRNARVAALLEARPEPTRRLKAHGIDYVALDGPVGLLSVGAGETMAAMDLLAAAGTPAGCFLDVSGGFDVEAITAALREVAALPALRVALFNVFGGLTRVDRVGESIVAARQRLAGFPVPLVVRLEGTEAERGRAVVEAHGLRCERTLRGAISTAAALAGGSAA